MAELTLIDFTRLHGHDFREEGNSWGSEEAGNSDNLEKHGEIVGLGG
jgi:hypothetical protein